MVKEFLEKTRDELLEQQIVCTDRLSELNNKLKENLKFISMLEETSDPNAAAFTPRKINGPNDQKIQELKDEQVVLSEQIHQAQLDLDSVMMKIYEINSVIKVAGVDSEDGGIESKYSKSVNRLAILETQEKERQRIARDLHDSTVQNLTSLVHKTELCMKLMDVDPVRSKLELSSLSKILRDIISDTRNMIYDLRPMSFDDIGFDITIERFLDRLKGSTIGVKFSYQVTGDPYQFNSVIALTLLRIIQEACNNALKHAKASEIKVRLDYRESEVELSIEDNGCGFDTTTLPEHSRDDNSGFGMSMMRERVFLLSGTIDVSSNVGEGCSIKVIIPINKEEVESGS